jgi:hypothetical protein
MQEYLQNLVSQGYVTAAELTSCRIPEDPTSPFPTGGGGWGICRGVHDVLAHRFLRSLLQLYGLEPHHLTPSGILHMAAFVTLCEAYKGIEPYFNL